MKKFRRLLFLLVLMVAVVSEAQSQSATSAQEVPLYHVTYRAGDTVYVAGYDTGNSWATWEVGSAANIAYDQYGSSLITPQWIDPTTLIYSGTVAGAVEIDLEQLIYVYQYQVLGAGEQQLTSSQVVPEDNFQFIEFLDIEHIANNGSMLVTRAEMSGTNQLVDVNSGSVIPMSARSRIQDFDGTEVLLSATTRPSLYILNLDDDTTSTNFLSGINLDYNRYEYRYMYNGDILMSPQLAPNLDTLEPQLDEYIPVQIYNYETETIEVVNEYERILSNSQPRLPTPQPIYLYQRTTETALEIGNGGRVLMNLDETALLYFRDNALIYYDLVENLEIELTDASQVVEKSAFMGDTVIFWTTDTSDDAVVITRHQLLDGTITSTTFYEGASDNSYLISSNHEYVYIEDTLAGTVSIWDQNGIYWDSSDQSQFSEGIISLATQESGFPTETDQSHEVILEFTSIDGESELFSLQLDGQNLIQFNETFIPNNATYAGSSPDGDWWLITSCVDEALTTVECVPDTLQVVRIGNQPRLLHQGAPLYRNERFNRQQLYVWSPSLALSERDNSE